MIVKCIPTKTIMKDIATGFSVMSCIPLGRYDDLELNSFHNFTISGDNLGLLCIGAEIEVDIEKDKKSRYKGSYVLLRYPGITSESGRIEIDQKRELAILTNFMTVTQAKHVHESYPNFISMILNNESDKIDYKIIRNVGKKRLSSYINKVVDNCKPIVFLSYLSKYGITKLQIAIKISRSYDSIDAFENDLKMFPYKTLIQVADISFTDADKMILENWPIHASSTERCTYCCYHILKENEVFGNTRANYSYVEDRLFCLAPECAKHFNKVIDNRELFYWNDQTQKISLMSTALEEKTIAEILLSKYASTNVTTMQWKMYRQIDGMILTDEQMQVLQFAQDYGAFILTAPAGGGKTSSMRALIKMLEDYGYSYTMLCPTGTAAKVLSKATGRTAKTIHKFLGANEPCGRFLILEEASMVGVHLMAALLSVIDQNTKIILICDPSQLPSIECGNIVHDLLEMKAIPTVYLTKIFRYNSSGLVTIATDTRKGTDQNLTKKFDDYRFVPIEKTKNTVNFVCNAYKQMLDNGISRDDILILSPFNVGPYGTYEINNAIQAKFNDNDFLDFSIKRGKVAIKFKIGDKIVNKKNNYRVPVVRLSKKRYNLIPDESFFVANGSVGTILSYIDNEEDQGLVIQFNDDIGFFSGKEINNLLLGYAISIHAAQGNQAKFVIVILDKSHKKMMSRNIEYVAFTRAQNKLIVIGDQDTISDGMKIEETNKRDTNLKDFLKMGLVQMGEC